MTKTQKIIGWTVTAIGALTTVTATEIYSGIITNTIEGVTLWPVFSWFRETVTYTASVAWNVLWSWWSAVFAAFVLGFCTGRFWVNISSAREPKERRPSREQMELLAILAENLRELLKMLLRQSLSDPPVSWTEFDADEKNFQDAMKSFGVDIPSWSGSMDRYDEWGRFDEFYEKLQIYLRKGRWKEVKEIVQEYKFDRKQE